MLPILCILFFATSVQSYAQQTPPLPQTDTPGVVVASEEDSTPVPPTKKVKAEPVPIVSTTDRANAPKTLLSKEEEIKRLMDLPPFNLQTNKAPLGDVMILLADACRMSYIGLEKGTAENIQISVNINKNPYELIRYLATQYNLAVEYEAGVWHFGLYNDKELIARLYHIRYNSQDEAASGGSSSSSSTGSASGSTSSSGSTGGSSNTAAIVKDIETFLGFTTDNPSILTAADFDVSKITALGERGFKRTVPDSKTADQASSASGDGKGKVIYNSDNKTMYVMATRVQHQWIEKYIEAVDRPQKQILIETKIYETSLSPETALGFDWNSSLTTTATKGKSTIKLQGNKSQVSAGTNGNFDTSSLGGLTAIISNSEFGAAVRALDSDSNSTSVQYPRQVTVSNRSVTMKSTQQIPIKQTSTTTETNTTGTQVQTQVDYIDVGTDISILPRILDENKIQMDIKISVSSITGYKVIDSNEYPIKSNREYATQAIVENGYTLAIGGLKESLQSDTYEGIPVLSKVPLFGALFKQRTKTNTDRNLLIFISPVILQKYRGGMEEDPAFVMPRTNDKPLRVPFSGSVDASYTDIMLALNGFERDIDEMAHRAEEGLSMGTLDNKVDALANEIKLIHIRLQELAIEQPNKDLSEASSLVDKYNKDLHELRNSISKRRSIIR